LIKASFNKTSKSFHFFYLLIGIGVLLLILSPKANANEANCYSSKNSDQKNFCLATAKHLTVTQFTNQTQKYVSYTDQRSEALLLQHQIKRLKKSMLGLDQVNEP